MPTTRYCALGQRLRSAALRYQPRTSVTTWAVAEGLRSSASRIARGDRTHGNSSIDGGLYRPEKVANLEAVLFLAREPLGSRKLALLGRLADGTEARTLVRTLNRLYDEEGCAFRVVEVAGGFQVMSRAKFAPWLGRLQVVPTEVRLSVPALETLAVVAYRQPVLRADVEAVRGVQCGEILRQLMERGLVRIVGKSEELGRPFLYGTTRQFLQAFGLRDLDQLPRPAWYRPDAAGRPAAPEQSDPQDEMLNQLVSNNPGGSSVKTSSPSNTVWEEGLAASAVAMAEKDSRLVAGPDDLDDEEFEDEDEDLEEDEEEEEEDLDEDLEDEDFEDSDWEEVEDEDEDLEEDEDEDLEDEEDEDWDDEDWDEDEDEDWEDEEEDDEGDEDWEE